MRFLEVVGPGQRVAHAAHGMLTTATAHNANRDSAIHIFVGQIGCRTANHVAHMNTPLQSKELQSQSLGRSEANC